VQSVFVYLASAALAALMLTNQGFAQDTPRDGGSITVHINRDIGGFDHIKVPQGGMGRYQVLWAVHEKFFDTDENGDFVPALATEATTSEDFKTWTIKLREGLSFRTERLYPARLIRTISSGFRAASWRIISEA